MELFSWTLIVIICTCVYYYFKRRLEFFKRAGIPYVPAWPFLGNMASAVFRRKHITEVIREVYDSSPGARYVGVFDFTQPTILLRDLELIKSVTIKNFDYFPNHNSLIDEKMEPLFTLNLFNLKGEKWREARTMLSPAFTSSKMKVMFEFMNQCGRNLIKHIADLPPEAKRMTDTKDLFSKYTVDVIASCAYGLETNSLREPDNEFYKMGKEAVTIDSLFTIKFFIARLSTKLLKLLRLKFVKDSIRYYFTHIISSTVKTRDEKQITRPDMLQLMMDARKKMKKYLKMDIDEMTAQAFVFFFAGFDTTSTQMCVMAHELALNPIVQTRLHEEIDEVLDRSRGQPTYEDISNMLYLDAVFHETVRRHSQISFIDRVCVSPVELPPPRPGGRPFTVEPGMNIWISPAAIHHDPNYYEDPERFNPERYYGKKVGVNDVLNLGFGIGPRSCIGNRFATLEVKILFFYLLSNFNLKPNEKTCNPLKYSKSSFSIVAEGGFWVAIEPREHCFRFPE